jgi:spore coat protein A, manganese oxidase
MSWHKKFLKIFLAITVAAGILGWGAAGSFAAQNPQIPLPAVPAWQFQQPLPILSLNPYTLPLLPPYLKAINTVIGSQPLTIRMCEFDAKVLPPGAITPGVQTTTRVWGYLDDPTGTSTCAGLIDLYDDGVVNGTAGPLETYTGPVIVNTRGTPTPITFINDLGTVNTGNAATDTKVEFYKYSIDQTLAWADPLNNEANNCANTGGIPAFGTSCAQNYSGPIAAVVHLHGGDVPPELDGGPDAWVTSDGAFKGHGYYTSAVPGDLTPGNGAIYRYGNMQEAAPIWFHDHLLGGTRLNVHAGLAGAYYIQDPALTLPPGLQPLTEVIPIVIQDRMFDTNGQLFFPADSTGGVLYSPNPEHPYWVPEFFGDTILVNGKAWPFLDVEAKRYRFLFVNGSNARTYVLNMGPIFYVIGTDGGYLDVPVAANKLVIMPGERYEVIIDFAGFAGRRGRNIILTNTGRAPYPKGVAPGKTPVSDVMQFRVHPVAAGFVDTSYNPALGAPLRTGAQTIVRLPGTPLGPAMVTAAGPTQNVHKVRQLTLNESLAPPSNAIDPVTGVLTAYLGGPLEVMVNNTKYDGIFQGIPRGDFTPVTVGGKTTYYSERSIEGETEVWEIVNLTVDAHPIHLHLVQFQVINRQNFALNRYLKAYNAAFPGGGLDPLTGLPYPAGVYIPGFGPPLNYNPIVPGGKYGGNPDITPYLGLAITPPLPQEAGWKDTVVSYPGQVTRIAVRFAPTHLPNTSLAADLFYPFDPSGGTFPHGYVWHCHIIDHEDNEMMRPSSVSLNPVAPAANARPLQKGRDY